MVWFGCWSAAGGLLGPEPSGDAWFRWYQGRGGNDVSLPVSQSALGLFLQGYCVMCVPLWALYKGARNAWQYETSSLPF